MLCCATQQGVTTMLLVRMLFVATQQDPTTSVLVTAPAPQIVQVSPTSQPNPTESSWATKVTPMPVSKSVGPQYQMLVTRWTSTRSVTV